MYVCSAYIVLTSYHRILGLKLFSQLLPFSTRHVFLIS